MNNPELATKMGKAGKQFVYTKFDAETIYNQLIQVIKLYS
jgi:hypothetical protein